MSGVAEANSESVEDLIGDGQSFEAGLISGAEGHMIRTRLKFTRDRFRKTMCLANT